MEAHFIEDIELIGSLILDKDLRLQILSKYDNIINPETRKLTCNTTSDLSTLLNEQVYYTAMCATQSMDRIEFESLNNLFNNVQAPNGGQKEDEVYKALKQFTKGYIGLTDLIMGDDDLITIDGVQEALKAKEPIFDDTLSDINTDEDDYVDIDIDIEPQVTEESIEQQVDEELDSLIDNLVFQILSIYDKIYRPLFNEPPVGVLFTNKDGQDSIMTTLVDGDNINIVEIPNLKFFAGSTYDAIKSHIGCIKEAPRLGDYGMSISSNWINPDGSMIYNYVPYIQVLNVSRIYFDRKTNSLRKALRWDEFSTNFENGIKPSIQALFRKVDTSNRQNVERAAESIKSLYTNIILANDFDGKKALRFTINIADIAGNKAIMNGIANAIIRKNPFTMAIDSYKIMNNSTKDGVQNILIVTNEAMYKGELMWAYKLMGKVMQNGGFLSLRNTIAGVDLTGETYTVNLADQANTIISVIAGSGSGKGVLTLALVASMIGSRAPVVYVDYKPDMANALWEMRNKYGYGILAVDGAGAGRNNIEPGWGMSKELSQLTVGLKNTIPYVKAIQLMNLLGQYRISHPQKVKAFFILDEAQKAGSEIMNTTDKLEQILKQELKLTKDSNASTKELNRQVTRLRNLYTSTGGSLDTFQKTNARSGNMSAIILGQSPEANGWPRIFYNVVSSSPLRFLGSGTYNPNSQTKAGCARDINGGELLGRGYFAVCKGTASTSENTTVIKTAMIVNEADFDMESQTGGKYTGALLTNIDSTEVKDSVIKNDLTVSNENKEIASVVGANIGESNPLVGFSGIIELIGKMSGDDFDLTKQLSAGEAYLEELLTELGIMGENGKYSSVEAYLYSGKPDSIFTFGEMSEALKKGMNIYEYISSGGGVDEGDACEPNMNGNINKEDPDSNIIGFTSDELENKDKNTPDTTNPFSNIGTPLPTQGQSNVLTNMQQAMAKQEGKTVDTQSNSADAQANAQKAARTLSRINRFVDSKRLLSLINEGRVSFSTIYNYDKDIINAALSGPVDLTNTTQAVLGIQQQGFPITYVDICKIISNYCVIDSCKNIIMRNSRNLNDMPQNNSLDNIVNQTISCLNDMLLSAYNIEGIASMLLALYKMRRLNIDTMVLPDAVERLFNKAIAAEQMDSAREANITGANSTGANSTDMDSAQPFGQPVQPVGQTAQAQATPIPPFGQPVGQQAQPDRTIDASGYDAEGFDTNGFNSDGMTREMVANKQALENMLKQAKLQNNQAAAQSIINLLNNIQEEAIANQLGNLENFQPSPEAQFEDAGVRKMPGNQTIRWLENNDIALDAQVNDGVLRRNIQVAPDTLLVKPTGLFTKSRMKAFQNANSASYTLSKCWDNVLNEISKTFHGDNFMVKEVAISNPNIIVNKNAFNLGSALYLNNLSLEDIVSLKSLFKKFPMIQKLLLDEEATNNVIYEYGEGTNAFKQMFIDNAKLRLIIITVGGRQSMITRESIVATAQFIDKEMGEVKTKQVIDAQCARLNPRLSLQDDTHILNRAHRALIGNGTDFFKKSHDVAIGDGDKKIRKWCAYTALGLGAVAVSGFLGIPKMVNGWFKKSK